MLADPCADLIVPKAGEQAALCRRTHVRRLDLFGSATTGRFDPMRSDLDFLVAFETMPPRAYAPACRELRSGLGELFGRPIDLLTEAALANPYLRRQIESEKRQLFPFPRSRMPLRNICEMCSGRRNASPGSPPAGRLRTIARTT